MKKVLPILIVLIIIAVLIVVGLIFIVGENNNNPQNPVITQNNFEINFDANATTGFSWSYTIDKEGIVELVRDEYIANSTDTLMVGVGGKQYYEFKGLSEGTAVITFTYSQSWDKESAPAQIIAYSLTVDNNLKVTAIKIENSPVTTIFPNTYEVFLDANASTGFTWSYTMDNKDVVKEVGKEYIAPTDTELIGASGKQKFIYEGLKAGQVTLTFVYSRSWEKDVPPAETKTIDLLVDEALHITEIKNVK